MINAKISAIKFENSYIIYVIKALDQCKAHWFDDISIRMLRMCNLAIVKPPASLSKNCFSQDILQEIWKKLNIWPIHKKIDKQILNNYRPVSLISLCGKIFKRITSSSLHQLIEEHKVLLIQKSSFRSNGSCISQLLIIVQTLYKAFDVYLTLDTSSEYVQSFWRRFAWRVNS